MKKPQYVAKAATLISDPVERSTTLYELLVRNRDGTIDREVKASWARLGGSSIGQEMPAADNYYWLFSQVLFDTGHPEEAKSLFENSKKNLDLCYNIAGYLVENGRGAEGKDWLARCPAPSGADLALSNGAFWQIFSNLIDRYVKDQDIKAVQDTVGLYSRMAATNLIDVLGLVSDKLWASGHTAEAQKLDKKTLQAVLGAELRAKYDMNVAVRLAMRLANHDLSEAARPLLDRTQGFHRKI